MATKQAEEPTEEQVYDQMREDIPSPIPDPLQAHDPWRASKQGPSQGDSAAQSSGVVQERPEGFQLNPNAPTFAVGSATIEPPPQRIIHDVPPVWDGKDPDNAVEPYLKSMKGWLNTTRTLKTQRGMTILHYAVGDLKTIINELDIDTLCSEEGGDRVFQHIRESYSEYLEKELPKAMERALYAGECRRRKDESMLQYVARKRTLFAELDRAKCPLPNQAKGYIMLRDAQLSNRAWDTIETWTRGTYQIADIANNLRNLERPVPGRTGTHMGFDGFQEDESLVCYEDHGDTPLSETS